MIGIPELRIYTAEELSKIVLELYRTVKRQQQRIEKLETDAKRGPSGG